jgi:hypothetical protein
VIGDEQQARALVAVVTAAIAAVTAAGVTAVAATSALVVLSAVYQNVEGEVRPAPAGTRHHTLGVRHCWPVEVADSHHLRLLLHYRRRRRVVDDGHGGAAGVQRGAHARVARHHLKGTQPGGGSGKNAVITFTFNLA